jgi:uncharacterized MnhB-related membrane protein
VTIKTAVDVIAPLIIALIVVIAWAIMSYTNNPNANVFEGAAGLVLGFYFGGNIHSAGVTNGADAANGNTPAS